MENTEQKQNKDTKHEINIKTHKKSNKVKFEKSTKK